MMKQMEKKNLAIVLALLGLGWFASRAKAPPQGVAAGISIAFYDVEGNLVPHNSPVTLVPGGTYYCVATVTNRSTIAGVAAPATFGVGILVSLGGYYKANYSTSSTFAANEVKALQTPSFSITEDDYWNQFGVQNLAVASVFAGDFLVQAQDLIDIAAPAIAYNATVTLGW